MQSPGRHYLHLSATQLAKRVAKADIIDRAYAREATHPDRARALYEAFPMSRFYTLHGRPCRVYGVTLSDEHDLLRVIVAGRPSQLQLAHPRDLTSLDRWPDDLLKRFRKGKLDDPGFFVDPLGFVAVIEKHLYPTHSKLSSADKLVITTPATVHFRVS